MISLPDCEHGGENAAEMDGLDNALVSQKEELSEDRYGSEFLDSRPSLLAELV